MKKKIIFLALCSSLLLAACDTTTPTEGGSSIVSEESTSSQAVSPEESVSWPTYNPISSEISTGGQLTEISLNIKLLAGRSYECTFSFSSASNETAQIFSTNEEYMSIEVTGAGTFRINCLKAGSPALFIRDESGYTHYRHNVHIVDPMDEDEIQDYMVNEVEYYQSWNMSYMDMQLFFIDKGRAILSGYDEGQVPIGSIEFDFELDHVDEEAGEFVFSIPEFENDYSDLNPTHLRVSMAGDIIHLSRGTSGTDGFYTQAVFQLPQYIG